MLYQPLNDRILYLSENFNNLLNIPQNELKSKDNFGCEIFVNVNNDCGMEAMRKGEEKTYLIHTNKMLHKSVSKLANSLLSMILRVEEEYNL